MKYDPDLNHPRRKIIVWFCEITSSHLIKSADCIMSMISKLFCFYFLLNLSSGDDDDSCYGAVSVSGSCATFNCFENSHILGFDITCESDVNQEACVSKCCSQPNCKGFDYSSDDRRCCTSSVSRADHPTEFQQSQACDPFSILPLREKVQKRLLLALYSGDSQFLRKH